MTRVGELLARQSTVTFLGRANELAALLSCLEPDWPLVCHVHGIGGHGKSALLDAFCDAARARQAAVVRVDCRVVEPTERGFLGELRAAVGAFAADVGKIASRLARLGDRVVIALDTYEVFRLMDTWLRQIFAPALPDSVRIVIAGRGAPVAAHRAADRGRIGPVADDCRCPVSDSKFRRPRSVLLGGHAMARGRTGTIRRCAQDPRGRPASRRCGGITRTQRLAGATAAIVFSGARH